MAEKFTNEQKQAIQSRGGSILVGAAAGSGKTTVLSERIVSMLANEDNPLDASKILVLTFSNSAASEMRQRIKRKLNERIAKDPGNSYLKRQQRQLRRARISTVHSFCAQLLREYFSSLNIPPDFTIADEVFSESLKRRALEQAMEECYSLIPDEMGELVRNFGRSRSDKEVVSAVSQLYEFEQTIAWPEKWEKMVLADSDPSIDPKSTGWGKYAREQVHELLDEAEKITRGSLALVSEVVPGDVRFSDRLQMDLVTIRELRHAVDSWNAELIDVLLNEKKPSFQIPRSLPEEIKDRFRARKDLVKDLLSRVGDKTAFAFSKESVSQCLSLQYPLMKTLIRIKEQYQKNLTELKEERKYFEYNDLETYSLQLLYKADGSISDEAASISSCYDQIFVDEFQDTNERQKAIFDAISHDGKNLFFVGDVKQSIYSFRRADPTIFMKVRDDYEGSEGEFPRYIALQHNFRSSKQVINSVNRIFDPLMTRKFGGVDYNKNDRLVKGDIPDSKEPQDPVGMELILVEGEGNIEENYVASRVKDMLDHGYPICDGDTIRPCRPEDFCILLRTAKNNFERFRTALNRYDIPCSAPGNDNFFESSEIRTMISLLRAIDNPRRDVDIVTVMLSPIGGFSVDDVVKLRLLDRKKKLWQLLLQQTDTRSIKFVNFLRSLREKASHLSVEELVGAAITDSEAEILLTAPPESERRKERLFALIDYASSYVQFGGKDLRDFLRHCESAADQGRGPSLGVGGDVGVTITTIHKAKGLEWPIVITANTEHQFNMSDSRSASVLFDAQCGAGMKLRQESEDGPYMETSPIYRTISQKKQFESKAEEMRILYVALTRARQKNIVTASFADKKEGEALKTVEKQKSRIVNGEVLPGIASTANSSLAWMLMSYAAEGLGNTVLDGATETDGTLSLKTTSKALEVSLSGEKPVKENVDDTVKEINRRTRFVYPNWEMTNLPTKITVTEMTHGDGFGSVILSRPSFAKAGRLSAAEQGTAIHRFMEVCDFTAAASDPVQEIKRLVQGQYLDEREAESIRPESVSAFFNSELGKQVLNAKQVLREYSFLDFVPAREYKDGLKSAGDEQILLQGIADCVLIQEDQAILIDFKTDRVKDP
ncbi:MAG: UvrD-helicase domain-containing protein, partial [Oscillospiraceae bacterium]|nr:UvrD-helicase domain-containing protein [Oscillospiraceae bacterium]